MRPVEGGVPRWHPGAPAYNFMQRRLNCPNTLLKHCCCSETHLHKHIWTTLCSNTSLLLQWNTYPCYCSETHLPGTAVKHTLQMNSAQIHLTHNSETHHTYCNETQLYTLLNHWVETHITKHNRTVHHNVHHWKLSYLFLENSSLFGFEMLPGKWINLSN